MPAATPVADEAPVIYSSVWLMVDLRQQAAQSDSDRPREEVMTDRERYKRAAIADIAYNMMRMWQGAVGVAPVDGLVSPAYVVARPLSHTIAAYFSYLFRTGAYMGEVNHLVD